MKRTAQAVWHGGLKEGKGQISTNSGVLVDTQYSFGTRFEEGVGTNPEELIAAAHAACFSMAFSAELEKAALSGPSRVETHATVTLSKLDTGWSVTEVHLDVIGSAPGLSAAQFDKHANDAKQNCPISRLLNTKITMKTQLREQAASA